MMNLQNIMGQLMKSQNPMGMIMNMLPNQNLKSTFSSLMNSSSDEERAQQIADLCNKNGITKKKKKKALKG